MVVDAVIAIGNGDRLNLIGIKKVCWLTCLIVNYNMAVQAWTSLLFPGPLVFSTTLLSILIAEICH